MAFRENTDFGVTYFLNLNSDGNLYERSKEPKEGFVQHINPITNAPSGYRKEYYSGVIGYIDHIGIKTLQTATGGSMQMFNITLKDYELNERYYISIPLLTQKGGIKNYVKSFVKYYKNIDFSREILFNGMKRKKDDEYASSELFMAYPGEKRENDILIERYYKKGQNGWPDPVLTRGYDGVERPDYKPQDDFAYNRLVEYIEEFNKIIPDIRKGILNKIRESAMAHGGKEGGNEGQSPRQEATHVNNQPVPSAIPPQSYQQPQQYNSQNSYQNVRNNVVQNTPQMAPGDEGEDLPF